MLTLKMQPAKPFHNFWRENSNVLLMNNCIHNLNFDAKISKKKGAKIQIF